MSDTALELHERAVTLTKEEKFDEAVGVLEQALAAWEADVGPDDPRLAPTLTNLAGSLQALGRHDEALPYAERAAGFAGGLDPDIAAQIKAQLAFVRGATRHPDAAEAATEALTALRDALGPNHPLTRQASPALEMLAKDASDAFFVDAQLRQAQELLEGGEPLAALSLVQSLLVRAVEEGATDLEAATRVIQVRALIDLDRHEEATPVAERALEIAMNQNDPEATGQFRALLATTRAAKGAEAAIAEARALLEEGHLRSAVSLLEALLVGSQKAGAKAYEATAHSLMAQACLALGEHERLGQHAARGRAIALGLDDKTALEHFDELLRMSVSPPLASRLARGISLVDGGKFEEGVEALAAVMPELSGGPDEANARGAIAHALLNLERQTDALPHLQAARSIAERAGASEAVAHYDNLIGKIA